MISDYAVPLLTALLSIALGVIGDNPRRGQIPHVHAGDIDPDQCSVHEVSRQRLVVEGNRQLYVQPVALVANSRGDVLLAGERNYLFGRNRANEWVREPDDSVFGAVLSATGQAHVVRSPVPMSLLGNPRAVARSDERWAVIFSEIKPYQGTTRPDTVVRLWYGVLEGTQWISLERLPLPSTGILHPSEASSLVQYGDTLAWAIGAAAPDGQRTVIVYEMRDGRWSYDSVPVLVGSYPDLSYSPTLGLVLAIVQPDLTLPSDGNSLFLWAQRPRWRKIRKVVSSDRETVHQPHLQLSPGGGTLSWQADVQAADARWREAHAMVGHPEDGDEPVIELDSAVMPSTAVRPITLPDGQRLWLTDHVLPGGGEREIRFVRYSGPAAALIGQISNPFRTSFTTAATSPADVLIAGGWIDQRQGFGVSLLLRVRVRCRTIPEQTGASSIRGGPFNP